MKGETHMKFYNEAEREEELRSARAAYDAVAPELQHMVADNDGDFLAKIDAGIQIEPLTLSEPRPLSASARQAQDCELLIEQWGYTDPYRDLPPALRASAEARDRESLQKLLGPGQRAKNELEQMIGAAVEKAVRELAVMPRRETDREGIMPRLAAATEGDDSEAARFVRAYVEGDKRTQRLIARELAAA
jgi:hypothetical protein